MIRLTFRKHFRCITPIFITCMKVGLFVVGGIFLLLITSNAQSAIDLLYFRALPGNEVITIKWATANEMDTSGFYVLRSQNQNDGFTRISSFIFSRGDTLTGHEYEHKDNQVENGVGYWYKLEEIDTNQRSSYHAPVFAVAGNPTATATLTRTPTKTFTQAPQQTNIIVTSAEGTKTITPTVTHLPRQDFLETETSQINSIAPSRNDGQLVQDDTPYPDIVNNSEVITSTPEIYPLETKYFEPFPSVEIRFPTEPLRLENNHIQVSSTVELIKQKSEIDLKGFVWVGLISFIWLGLLFMFLRAIHTL
jgi:hypothetical protein